MRCRSATRVETSSAVSRATRSVPNSSTLYEAGAVDPEVHRVHGHEAGVGALLAHAALEIGLDVGQEEDFAVLGRLRELGLEGLEDVEVGGVRQALVEVVAVLAGPEEGLAAGH